MSSNEDSLSSPPEFIDPLSADENTLKDDDLTVEEDLDKALNDLDLSKDMEGSEDYDFSFSDDPNSQDLFITVTHPEKHILAMETYISYKVSMKTTRSTFDDCKYSVRRRFQDFVWLRNKFEEDHPTHFIPPLPSKLIVKGMVERFTSEFVNTRQQALDSFMKRIAEHPVLSCNEHLKIFLTSKAHEFTQHRKNNSSGYLSKVGGTVKAVAGSVKLKTKDEGFEEISEKVAQFKDKMGVVDRVIERIMVEEKELPYELQEYSTTYSMWGDAEEQSEVSQLLEGISKTLGTCADASAMVARKHYRNTIPPVKEYILYCDSISQVLRRRDALQSQRDKTLEELKWKKQEKEYLPKSDQSYSLGAMMGRKPEDVRKEKEDKLEQSIAELTKQHEDLSDKVECANANIKADMERWDVNRKKDVNKILTQMADSHIDSLSKQMASWESLIPMLHESSTVEENEDI